MSATLSPPKVELFFHDPAQFDGVLSQLEYSGQIGRPEKEIPSIRAGIAVDEEWVRKADVLEGILVDTRFQMPMQRGEVHRASFATIRFATIQRHLLGPTMRTRKKYRAFSNHDMVGSCKTYFHVMLERVLHVAG
jgi:hypothetical protein